MISKRQRENAARYKVRPVKDVPNWFIATDGKKEYHVKKLPGMLKFWCNCGVNALDQSKLCSHSLAVIESRRGTYESEAYTKM